MTTQRESHAPRDWKRFRYVVPSRDPNPVPCQILRASVEAARRRRNDDLDRWLDDANADEPPVVGRMLDGGETVDRLICLVIAAVGGAFAGYVWMMWRGPQ